MVAVIGGNPEPLYLGMPLLWAIVFSFIDGWWPQVVVSNISLSSERLIEGDDIEFRFDLSAPRGVGWVETEIQVPSSLVVSESREVGQLAANRVDARRVKMRVERWGVVGPEWLTVVSRDRFGMTECVQQIPIVAKARVHPPTERLTSLIPPSSTRQVTGDHRSTRRGLGAELAAVRPYRPGDPIRMIHARLSSRRGKPMVLERHPDESADIVLFVDSVQDIGSGLDTSLRWTVTAAMALTQRHLRSMDRVGILDRGAGVRWLQPKLGRKALHVIVDALLSTVVLQPRAGDQFSVPVERIPKGATVFCISPLLSAVVRQDLLVLRRRGHEVIAIQPSPAQNHLGASLAERISRVSNEVRRRDLVRQGVVVIPWDPDEPLEPTLRSMGRSVARSRVSVSGGTL